LIFCFEKELLDNASLLYLSVHHQHLIVTKLISFSLPSLSSRELPSFLSLKPSTKQIPPLLNIEACIPILFFYLSSFFSLFLFFLFTPSSCAVYWFKHHHALLLLSQTPPPPPTFMRRFGHCFYQSNKVRLLSSSTQQGLSIGPINFMNGINFPLTLFFLRRKPSRRSTHVIYILLKADFN